MNHSLIDYLIRTVLDDAFRELAIADPQAAFEGYDLGEEEKDILRSRDRRMLGLLGKVAAGARTSGESEGTRAAPPVATAPTQPNIQGNTPLPELAELNLLLRLIPQAVQGADGGSKVAYAASLHPWTGDNAATPVAGGDDSGTGEGGGEPGEIKWTIRIRPTVLATEAAGLRVAYSASIHPLTSESGHGESQESPAESPPAGDPWNHQIDSDAAKTAARAVKAAARADRFERLLDLVEALQTGDQRG